MTHPAEPQHDESGEHVNDGADTASHSDVTAAGTTASSAAASPAAPAGARPDLEPWLREIVRCPRCKGELADAPEHDALTCGVCDLSYPVENGVPVLLVELARPLGG